MYSIKEFILKLFDFDFLKLQKYYFFDISYVFKYMYRYVYMYISVYFYALVN